MRSTESTNENIKKLIGEISSRGHKEENNFLLMVYKKLKKPRRAKADVNLDRLERLTKENSIVFVPGSVLAYGEISKPIFVGALKFSKKAKEKIETAGGKAMLMREFVEKYPKGDKVRVIE